MKSPNAASFKTVRVLSGLATLILIRGAGTVLSFFVTILIVERFGTSPIADGLLASRRLMMQLGEAGRQLVQNALVPSLAHSLHVPDASLFRRAVLLRVYQAGAIGLVASALLSILSADIVGLIGAGFDEERRNIATNALFVLAFLLPPMLAVGVLTAAANVLGVYGLPDAAQLAPRLLVLSTLALLPPAMSAATLPWAYVVGASAGLGFVLLSLAGRLWGGHGANTSDAVKSVAAPGKGQAPDATAARFWALFVILGAAQVNLWIQLHYAAKVGAGAITYLECSMAIMSVLPTVFLRSAFSVAYAESARQVEDSKQGVSAALLVQLIETGLFFMLPVILLPTIFADHISHLLFVRGSFSAADAQQVALLIRAFSFGAIFAVIQYALNIALLIHPGIPLLRISAMQEIVSVLTTVFFLQAFTPLIGISALPLAVAASGVAVAAVRFAATKAWRPAIAMLLLGRRFWSILLAASLFSAIGIGVHSLLPAPAKTPTLTTVTMLLAFGAVGTALYLLAGMALGLWRPSMLRQEKAVA